MTKKIMKHVSLNGDVLTYYRRNDRELVLSFQNSGYTYYLPENWYIERNDNGVSPIRLGVQRMNDDDVTVATSRIFSEIELLAFMKEMVLGYTYNNPNVIKVVTKTKNTIYLDVNRLSNHLVSIEINSIASHQRKLKEAIEMSRRNIINILTGEHNAKEI